MIVIIINISSSISSSSSMIVIDVSAFPGSTRSGLRFSDASWLDPVRFGSFPHPVPAGSEIKRFGSARPVPFGVLKSTIIINYYY